MDYLQVCGRDQCSPSTACCQAKSWAPSSAVETATVDLDASAPDLLARHLVFDPGGSVGWENYRIVGLTNM